MQQSVRPALREGPQRQRTDAFLRETAPVAVQQHVPVVARQATHRGILMEQREEGPLLVGHDLHEGIAEEHLVERQFAEHLPQGFAVAVGVGDESSQPRQSFAEREPFSCDIIGLVIDDAPMGHAPAEHFCQGKRKQVVVAPPPAGSRIARARRGTEKVPPLAAQRKQFRYIMHPVFLHIAIVSVTPNFPYFPRRDGNTPHRSPATSPARRDPRHNGYRCRFRQPPA